MDLNDITVLDLSKLLPGPYATQLLRDFGAEVIKVEPPNGDPARDMQLLTERQGRLFEALNRGKKSVTLDLRQQKPRECFYELVAEVDVVLEQYRPGVAEKLGVDYDKLTEYNQEVIYCSLTGYGQDGPYASRVGHDLNYLGLSGFLDMNRDKDGTPVLPGAPIADMSGGLFAVTSILAALLDREIGDGEGEYIDLSMTDAALSFSQVFALVALSGRDPHETLSPLTGEFPCYGVYETADGRYVTIAAIEPRFWEALCNALDRGDLVEDHMAESPEVREHVYQELKGEIASRKLDELDALLGDKDTMFGPVNTYSEAVNHPQIRTRDLIMGSESSEKFVGLPMKTDSGTAYATEAPDLGAQTDEILEKYDARCQEE